MRHPIRHLAGNLIWTTYGTVWAVWRVHAPQYRHTTSQTKTEVLEATEALLRSLPAGEALLLSLCPQVDTDDVYDRMLGNADTNADTGDDTGDGDESGRWWAQVCDAYADELDKYVLTERTHWLAVPLPSTGKEQLAQLVGAAWAQVADAIGVPPVPVSRTRVDACLRAAHKVASGMPGGWLRPAEPAEILWMYRRAALRGLDEPPLERGASGGSRLIGDRLRGPWLGELDELHFDEGGKNGRRLVLPFAHRYLKVTHPHASGTDIADSPSAPDGSGSGGSGGASYQAFLALAEMPPAFVFPGSEYLERLDDFPVPVDWAARLRIVPRDQAEASTRRRARELTEQTRQRGDDTGSIPPDLDQALRDMDDYRTRLASSASEVEVQAGVVFCVWSDDPDTTDEYATMLRRELAPSDYQAVRVTGGQADLYSAMLPGYPTPRVVRDYTQYLLARDFAMAIPFANTRLGDPAGGLLGLRIDSAGVAPVLHDPSYAPRVLHASASAAMVGDLGSGKSVTLKVLADMIVRRGGIALAIDRTPSREWARFASAVPGTTQIVDVSTQPEISLDPFRIFPAASVQRYVEGFIGLLLGLEGLSSEAAVLSEAIDTVLSRSDRSMPVLIEALGQMHDRRADDLRRRLQAACRLDLARAVFDNTLPALEVSHVDAGAGSQGGTVVFATSGIALPDRDELASEHQMRQIPPEKRLGRAVLYLVAALCRERAFTTGRYAGIFLDECYWLTSSTEGERLSLELVRDGRKHNAAAYLGAHDPADLGGETISGLLGQRFLLRHRDHTLAEHGLRWLGLEPDDELRHLVTRELSPVDVPEDQREERAGECLYRDCHGRISLMKVLIPNLPGFADAIHTNPTDDHSDDHSNEASVRPTVDPNEHAKTASGSGASE